MFVNVCRFAGGHTQCETFPVVTQCAACRWSAGAVLVDLSGEAWDEFHVARSVGVLKVTVEVLR